MNSINVATYFIKGIVIGINIAMSISFKVRKRQWEICWTKQVLPPNLRHSKENVLPWTVRFIDFCSKLLRQVFVNSRAFGLNPRTFDFPIKNQLSDIQKLLRDLLIMCVKFWLLSTACLYFFHITNRHCCAHYNPFEKLNFYFKRNSSISKLTC